MSRSHACVGVALAAAGAAVLVAGALRPKDRGAGRAAGDAFAGVPGLEDRSREGEDLDARLVVSHARLCEKSSVVAALVRGEIGLRAAAERFRVLVAGYPAALDGLRRAYPRATETELLYRHVLSFVRGASFNRPDITPGLLDRLEAELAATFPASPKSRPGFAGDRGIVPPGIRAE